MRTNPEPDRNIEELNDDEIYAAIRYLESDPGSANKQSDDTTSTQENERRRDLRLFIHRSVRLPSGLLAVLEMILVSGKV